MHFSRSVVVSAIVLVAMSGAGYVAGKTETPEVPEVPPLVVEVPASPQEQLHEPG